VVITPSKLRENLYRILDRVLDTGEPVEIERRGRRLRIVAEPKRRKLDSLKRRDYLNVEPDELVHIDWSGEWRP
jgi:PHD/YefM family antitoxin component YafN of YafNO toxin-antitoxin module